MWLNFQDIPDQLLIFPSLKMGRYSKFRFDCSSLVLSSVSFLCFFLVVLTAVCYIAVTT